MTNGKNDDEINSKEIDNDVKRISKNGKGSRLMKRDGTGKVNKVVENNAEDSNFKSSKNLENVKGNIRESQKMEKADQKKSGDDCKSGSETDIIVETKIIVETSMIVEINEEEKNK